MPRSFALQERYIRQLSLNCREGLNIMDKGWLLLGHAYCALASIRK